MIRALLSRPWVKVALVLLASVLLATSNGGPFWVGGGFLVGGFYLLRALFRQHNLTLSGFRLGGRDDY